MIRRGNWKEIIYPDFLKKNGYFCCMNDNWVNIYSTQKEHIAEIVKAVLEDNNISCVLVSKKDSAYLFGEIELYVNTENVLRAKQIINREKL